MKLAGLLSTARTSTLVLAAALALGGLSACQGEPVGRLCFVGDDTNTQGEAIVASPALECQSRTCLRMPGAAEALCTAGCDGSGDCDGVDESPCLGGFACMVPVTVGPFCCEKLCVCKDYLPETESGDYPAPAACDAGNAVNECCNLDGRRGNAAYPQCG